MPKRTKAGTTVHEANILGAVNVKKPKLDPALAVSTSLAAEVHLPGRAGRCLHGSATPVLILMPAVLASAFAWKDIIQ